MKTTFLALALLSSVSMIAQGPAPRAELNLDQVYSEYGLDGTGTLVILIDRGIDYQHEDFIDENGDTRIAYIYDMIDDTGADDLDNPYGIGTIFDEGEINAALDNGGDPITMDWYGHGTATAGISAGDGSAIESGIYHGVAPDATIIAIKVTLDPFPPFGTHPGQTGFFNPAYIETALEFAHDKSVELGLPTVALVNLGSTGGSTDGTSTICQAMDAFVAQGHTLICGVGDDGGGVNHAQATVSQNGTIELVIDKGTNANLRFDLWYSEDDRFTVSVERPDLSVAGPYAAPENAGASSDWFEADFNLYHRGADVEFSGATSNRRELLIDFFGNPGTYKVILEGTDITNGEFHATLNPGGLYGGNGFESYAVEGYTIADYASAFDIITPTNYVIINQWIDIDGNLQGLFGQGDPEDIWLGSSMGPTHDGRLGVDCGIPGEVCFTAYSEGTLYENYPFNMIEDGEGHYGIQNAVSACAPQLTGIVALMLEANPDLTPAEIKQIIQESCIEDSFTGSVPNAQWGFGKLDAYVAIEAALNATSVKEESASKFSVFPNPVTDELRINWNGHEQAQRIEIRNTAGTLVEVLPFSNAINIDYLVAGAYFIRIVSESESDVRLITVR